jgi:uncharacterized membrane protein
MGSKKILLATGLGSGLMYLLDPRGGRRRRAMAADKIRSAGRKTGRFTGKMARDLTNRARGVAARTRSRFSHREVPDEVLHDQIRSRLGRVVSHPAAVEVYVRDGEVYLRGPILSDEVDLVLSELCLVQGVRGVSDELEVREEQDLSSLQGAGRTRRLRAWKRDTWPPRLRLAAGFGGVALLFASSRRSGLGKIAFAGAGTGLLLRSVFNLPWSKITGLGTGRTAVEVRKSIFVDAPVEEVFDFWSNFENLARFFENVKEVRPTENPDEYQWTVAGPAGVPVQWRARVTKLVPNQQVGWKTVSDSVVQNAGRVTFEDEDGGTRVKVHLKYNPGVGAIGHAAAKLFGSDPKTLMDQDLVRMKTYLETWDAPADAEKPEGSGLVGGAS